MSADERDSAKSFLCSAVSNLNFAASLRTPNLSFHITVNGSLLCLWVQTCVCVCVCVCAQRACEDGGRCVLLSYVILAAVKVTLDFSQTHPYSCGKQAECLICTEDQKAFMKHTTFRTFSISDGASASVLSYIQASHTRVSVCLRGTEQTECDRGIF